MPTEFNVLSAIDELIKLTGDPEAELIIKKEHECLIFRYRWKFQGDRQGFERATSERKILKADFDIIIEMHNKSMDEVAAMRKIACRLNQEPQTPSFPVTSIS